MRKISNILFIFIPLFSCKIYKQDILLSTNENTVIQKAVYDVSQNYKIQTNDRLNIRVYTNKGEEAIDPNNDFLDGNSNSQNQQGKQKSEFLVQNNGMVKFPMIGLVAISGLTINQAESKLEVLYNEFYKDSFIKLEYLNKRVTVLGQISSVIPITDDNTSLLEILAKAGGVNFGGRAHNIRVIRGDLTNPEVFIVDLTSIEGMQASIVSIKPGDVIYVEPWRRPWQDIMRDVSPIFGLVTSITTLAFLIATL